jgi:putative ABC transport system ATP-binding protein
MTYLRVEDLTIEYVQGDYVVRPIQSLNLEASDGQLVLLLGPSGSGKTTLLSCLASILTPARGKIYVEDTEITSLKGMDLANYRRHGVGIVFQAFNLIPSLNARENVAAPLRLAGVRRREARMRADALLDRVGLGDRAHHRPAELSGGQQQRVAIARALVHDPPLVVADEPTAHLDYVQVEGVLALIRELAAPGRLVVVSTHDARFTPLADRVVELAAVRAEQLSAVRRVELAAGAVLFEQGDPSDLVYVVETGAIEVFRRRIDGGEDVLTTVRRPDYFGEIGPLLGLRRAASARALQDTVLTGYGAREFSRWMGGTARPPRTMRAP